MGRLNEMKAKMPQAPILRVKCLLFAAALALVVPLPVHANSDRVDVAAVRKAAEKGDAQAQYDLGSMYAKGVGVAKDAQQAVVWYRKAADQGVAPAQYNVGFMYESGYGVPHDAQQAVLWYRKAADQGLARAQYRLGATYARGLGVAKDAQEALVWYRKAADQGFARAQTALGEAYERGEGVPQDAQQAYFWLLLASAGGDWVATFDRDRIAELLTAEQRAATQAQAADWKPNWKTK